MPGHRGTLTGIFGTEIAFIIFFVFIYKYGILSEALGVLFTNKDWEHRIWQSLENDLRSFLFIQFRFGIAIKLWAELLLAFRAMVKSTNLPWPIWVVGSGIGKVQIEPYWNKSKFFWVWIFEFQAQEGPDWIWFCTFHISKSNLKLNCGREDFWSLQSYTSFHSRPLYNK